MSDFKVYVVNDRTACDYIANDDVDGFRAYIAGEDDGLLVDEPECFASEAEALAFCAGIGYGVDERAPVERWPLRSFEPTDAPFIEAIEEFIL